MSQLNLHVLVDAKTEYTKQLVSLLSPLFYEGISSIYSQSKKTTPRDNRQMLYTFQRLLSNIPKWNQVIIDQEYERIQKKSDCDWLDDLITAVFVSYTKILTSIKMTHSNSKTLNLKIPKGSHFIHKCYIEMAREFWKNPYLFYDIDVSTCDMQRNMRDCQTIISNCIEESVRKMLPVKHILQEYLGSDFEDEGSLLENCDKVEESISSLQKNNLKELVKHEIQKNLSNKKLSDNYSEYSIDTQLYDDNKDILNKKNNIADTIEDHTEDTLKHHTADDTEDTLKHHTVDHTADTLKHDTVDHTADTVEDHTVEDKKDYSTNALQPNNNSIKIVTIDDNKDIQNQSIHTQIRGNEDSFHSFDIKKRSENTYKQISGNNPEQATVQKLEPSLDHKPEQATVQKVEHSLDDKPEQATVQKLQHSLDDKPEQATVQKLQHSLDDKPEQATVQKLQHSLDDKPEQATVQKPQHSLDNIPEQATVQKLQHSLDDKIDSRESRTDLYTKGQSGGSRKLNHNNSLYLNRRNTRSNSTVSNSIFNKNNLYESDDNISIDSEKKNTDNYIQNRYGVVNLDNSISDQSGDSNHSNRSTSRVSNKSNKADLLNLLKPKSIQTDHFSHISVKNNSNKNVTFDINSASIDDYAFIDKKKR